jgi:hypothetical protein
MLIASLLRAASVPKSDSVSHHGMYTNFSLSPSSYCVFYVVRLIHVLRLSVRVSLSLSLSSLPGSLVSLGFSPLPFVSPLFTYL